MLNCLGGGTRIWLTAGVLALGSAALPAAAGAQGPADPAAPAAAAVDEPHRALVGRYCLSCHSDRRRTADLSLETINAQPLEAHSETWEKVARKLRARQMPPVGGRRPDEAAYGTALASLENELDALASAHPRPGRTDTFRRLNRTEYHNAVRDLLALEVDVADLLPGDASSFGFDNITVGDLSPTLLERYVSAAEKISQLAVGRAGLAPGGTTVRVRPDLTQEKHLEGLPIGTRGGALVPHTFPVDGVYEVAVRLARDRNEHVEGLSRPQDVELLLDRERLALFTVEPAPYREDQALNYQPSHDNLDAHLKLRTAVTAGPHLVGVTFPKSPTLLPETARQPYEAHFNYYRHPRLQPAVYQVSITGPYDVTGPGDTSSRDRIFTCRPSHPEEDDACAREILRTLLRRAYRRPVTDADLDGPFALYRAARDAEGFEAGIEMALAAVLVSPEFLFRIERDPDDAAPGAPYRLNDLALASRLSFFLWSSIPDDELLEAAERGELTTAAGLERQVRRMLADPRADNLVTNFAAQWLHLRNLDSIAPDMRRFPDFDDNLRQAFRRETELLVESVIREDRSALDLVRADYTFVNERLAKHYGIPHVYGSRFRRLTFDGTEAHAARGGLLRHGSILLVTSYATRTSPSHPRQVDPGQRARGAAAPAPAQRAGTGGDRHRRRRALDARAPRRAPRQPRLRELPPPDGPGGLRVRALRRGGALAGRRRRRADRRVGDALRRVALRRRGVAGGGPAGSPGAVRHHPGREAAHLRHRAGVTWDDAPAVRRIVRDAAEEDYRFSALVLGIVDSLPFQMRTASW